MVERISQAKKGWPNVRRVLIVLLVFLLGAGTIYPLKASDIRVVVDEGAQASVRLEVREFQRQPFVPLEKLANLLRARTYYNTLSKKVVLYLGNYRITVTAFNPFVVINGEVYQIPLETEYWRQQIWVPLKPFVQLIQPYYAGRLEYIPEERTLYVAREGINITGVKIEPKRNGTLIRIMTTRPFDTNAIGTRTSEGWLYVDIYGGRVDITRFYGDVRIGLVEKVVPIQFEESAQLSFQLKKQGIKVEDITVQSKRDEIWVSVRTKKRSVPQPVEKREPSKGNLARLEKERKKWIIDTIILDPGHGGRDPGAIGPTGLCEKDVTLDIAKRLKKLLERNLKVKVLMTRDKDRFMGLRERSAFANRHDGKLFISIHANAHNARWVRGFMTYCLGPAQTKEDLEIAQRENAVIEYEADQGVYGDFSNERFILLAMAQNSFNVESQELAAIIQEEARRRLRIKDLGVRQAGYLVLVGTSMPKVLVEAGFISNRAEERLLRSPYYRQKIAEVLYRSIRRFKERCERLVQSPRSVKNLSSK